MTSLINKREERHYFDLVYQPYYSDNNTKAMDLVTISHDVGEQVKARKKVRESENKYRYLFDAMDQGYCTLKLLFDADKCVDYRYLEINPAFERHSGLSGAIGKQLGNWHQILNPNVSS